VTRPTARSATAAGCIAALLLASAAGAQSSVSASPDVGVALGMLGQPVADHDVAVDNLLGMVLPDGLGPLPEGSDVSGYQLQPNGDRRLCFDTGIELPGPVFAAPGDVVSWDGAVYSILFDASSLSVPAGVRCDAVATDAVGSQLISFDTTVMLPPGVVAADEDLVRRKAHGQFSVDFDGSAAGIPEAADLDAAHVFPSGKVAVSLDVAANVGGIDADDDDILLYDPVTMTWSLLFDASAQDADWEAADVDAIPEPSGPLVILCGLAALCGGRRRMRP